MKKLRFFLSRRDFGMADELAIGYTDEQGKRYVAKPLEFEELENGLMHTPTLVSSDEAMQELVNELWRAGFRPTEYGSHTDKEALKNHLDDMRKIVGKSLKLDL